MRLLKILAGILAVLFIAASATIAGDFDWMKDFGLKAEADLSDFKARLSTRFKIGNAEINAVFSNVDGAADVYMIFRLGEMAGKPPEEVIKQYKSAKGKGWGVLAKSLGIKPGSQEFQALKRGDDLYGPENKVKSQGKDKGKDKSKK